MVKFLIQTENKIPIHDFGWHLIEAIKYQNWYGGKENFLFIKSETSALERLFSPETEIPKVYIPIGSVEFVHSYMVFKQLVVPKPLNVPQEISHYAGRNIKLGTVMDIDECSFVKSNTRIKGFSGIVDPAEARLPILTDDEYQISEIIDIDSEWRGFFHNKKLLDVKHYSGNPFLFPDIELIREMLDKWKSQPIAGTIDVAISKGDTVLMECHNFYSCGLYGFQDYRKLPIMFSQWWNEYLRKNQK